MKKLLFYFAITGWALALIVHALSIADFDIRDNVPFVWVLHFGVFVVWLPTVLILNKIEELNENQQSGILNRLNPFGFVKTICKQTPTWITVIAIGGFIYNMFNFWLFKASVQGGPDIMDGQYILQNHGKLIAYLTEQEYHHYRANEVRFFSGFWLAFYGIAAAVLFPFKRQSKCD